MLDKLFAIRGVDIQNQENANSGLKRILGPWALTALGVGSIIGTGIFVMTGQAAAEHAGPAIVLSFLLAGCICGFSALCYAEFASMIPVAGSAYSYAYATMGELAAWFIGWNLVLEYGISISAVAVSWSSYFLSFMQHFGLGLPSQLANSPIVFSQGHLALTGAWFNLPAVLVVLLLTAVCYVGIREAAWLNNVIVALKVGVVLLVILVGWHFVNSANWHPFIPPRSGDHYGWTGVFRGASVIFFAYVGFDAVTTASMEAKNPTRDMPFGIMASLIICTLLYIAMSGVLTGMESYTRLGTDAPVVTALLRHPALGWLRIVVEIGAIAGLASVILVMIVSQARIFFITARDGLLPPVFARIHPRYRTPHLNTLITGVIAALVGGLFPLDILGDLMSMGTIMGFMAVCLGILILRRTRPDLHRPFRVPCAPVVCTIGVLSTFGLLLTMGLRNWLLLGVWTAVGLLIYFGYGFRHSKLRGHSQA